MQVVISTQVMENYGSAETPHWKFKGGDIYFVEADAAMIADQHWWMMVEGCIRRKDSMFQEAIISTTIVDTIDFRPEDFLEEYETAVRVKTMWNDEAKSHDIWCDKYLLNWDNEIEGIRLWTQSRNAEQSNHEMFEFDEPRSVEWRRLKALTKYAA